MGRSCRGAVQWWVGRRSLANPAPKSKICPILTQKGEFCPDSPCFGPKWAQNRLFGENGTDLEIATENN